MAVETIGEALSLGWCVVARCVPVAARTGQARDHAGSVPTDVNWTWKRSCARAGERFRCRVSKADCDARDAAIGESW